jgi:hypothetical protein
MTYRAIAGATLLAAVCGSAGMAQSPPNLCQTAAGEIRENLMGEHLNALGPLEALEATGRSSVRLAHGDRNNPLNNWLSGVAAGQRLRSDHAAPEALAKAVEAVDSVKLIEVPGAPIWVFDHPMGSLGCHLLIAVLVQKGIPAKRIDLPYGFGEADLCGYAVKAVEIGHRPALVLEEDSWSNHGANSTLTLMPFDDSAVAPSCTLSVGYAIDFRAEHAFCRGDLKEGLDCAEIMHMAEEFAATRQAGKNAATLAIPVRDDIASKLRAGYQRMQETDGQTENLNLVPTFNKFIMATGANEFGDDEELFPFYVPGYENYLGRLGHGHRNYVTSVGYIFAAYGLNGDRTTPIAGVSIEAHRAGIESIVVK